MRANRSKFIAWMQVITEGRVLNGRAAAVRIRFQTRFPVGALFRLPLVVVSRLIYGG